MEISPVLVATRTLGSPTAACLDAASVFQMLRNSEAHGPFVNGVLSRPPTLQSDRA